MQQYWPQHKVFFIATLALFPEHLQGQVITELFYRPYFATDDVHVIELTLQEYQKSGYLTYEESGEYAWLVTDVNTQKAIDDLRQYLALWQSDHLKLLGAKQPATEARQQKLLRKALTNLYRQNPTNQQRVMLEDIFGAPNNDVFGTPFWELLLSTQLSDNPIAKVTCIGYDRSESGLYADNAQPYVDLEITDKDLLQELEMSAASQTTANEARVIMNGTEVCVLINGVSHVIKRLRKDGTEHEFMKYILQPDNYDIDITIKDIQAIEGLAGVKNLTEIIRYCGFNRLLKSAFFTKSEKERVHFKPITTLSTEQVRAVQEQAAKIVSKS